MPECFKWKKVTMHHTGSSSSDTYMADIIGRSRGRWGRAPLLSPIFFILMKFLKKIMPNSRFVPPKGVAIPPFGNPGSASGYPHEYGFLVH